MRSLLSGMTTRGSSFLAAGIAAALTGYLLGERALLCVGIALVALPLLAAAAARRGQYRLSVSRMIKPPRVPAGHTAKVTLWVENISRASTGLLPESSPTTPTSRRPPRRACSAR